MVRDTVIFLLQQLGFVLNLVSPTHRKELLGATVNSLIITLSLLEKKIVKSSEAVCGTQVSILALTKLTGLLSSTIQAVFPAQINFRYLQKQQMQVLKIPGVILLRSDFKLKLERKSALNVLKGNF